jgi:hypothetical protein
MYCFCSGCRITSLSNWRYTGEANAILPVRIDDRVQSPPIVAWESVALRRPDLALVSLGVRGLARRSLEIPPDSLVFRQMVGPFAQSGRLALHDRTHQCSLLHRPYNPTLQQTSELWKQRLRRCIL